LSIVERRSRNVSMRAVQCATVVEHVIHAKDRRVFRIDEDPRAGSLLL
jgi:hypothetical protein